MRAGAGYVNCTPERSCVALAQSGSAETGASGPTGNRYGDPPGHGCIAVSGPVEAVITVETGSADREANMRAFARAAVELLESCIRKGG